MSLWDSLCSVASSAWKTTKSAVSSAWETTKSVATKAVSFLAEKGEAIVETIKKVWKTVKPYIAKVRDGLKAAAKAVGVKFPWLSAGLLFIEKALHAIEKFSDSKLAKKIDDAIRTILKMAKGMHEKYLNKKEMEEAIQREEDLKKAESFVEGDEKDAILVSKMLNAYMMISTSIQNILTEKVSLVDFEHYLRLRAAQKLLLIAEDALSTAQSLKDITPDDLFIIDMGQNLIKDNPSLSDEEASRLDSIICSKHNKKLLTFVFEEMIVSWSANLNELEAEWVIKNKAVAKMKVSLRSLENEQMLVELSKEATEELVALKAKLSGEIERVGLLEKRKREKGNYIYAAEGLLQTIEKSPEELEAEDKDYLIDDSSVIGKLIIDCAQYGKKWEKLTEEEQSLISDYSNIFEESCKQRTKELLEVSV